jgi:hypothetical protein
MLLVDTMSQKRRKALKNKKINKCSNPKLFSKSAKESKKLICTGDN